jgi:CDGSH-type Zn-finger protein
VPYRDGPYLVRGPVVLRDQDGAVIECRRPVVALCRCGKSRTRPFCDGTHQVIRFSAPSHHEERTQDHSAGRAVPRPRSVTEPSRDELVGIGAILTRAQRSLDALQGNGNDAGAIRRRLIGELRAAVQQLEEGG